MLAGKRVWTEQDTYHSGERVRICAEVATNYVNNPEDYFVVAQCFPKSNPERSTKEIELDSQHLIKNLANVESPYGIWDFRKIPESWSRRWERTANASFEVKYAIKKIEEIDRCV